ncbi:putative retrotransposon hot spot protein (RHS) [Trypanosoma cruzi]|uniref:Putative retrotransposon hot spot protein (RHS) n=1 Tax=Trypanosoma cruzi TaxID=5693 RepID=A0A2V2VUC0_TRYCR|nr:putative retrotransposon hot spot protein (RHS) [Trypanosoma cruzi]
MLHRTGVVVAPRRGSCDGSDAAARRVAGSKVWPRWTMSSTVEEIPQEGNTSSTNMRLSDFLWNYVGGRAAVDEDYNVTMEVFVQEPDDCVQDQRLLEEILNLTAHQALEAITKPLHKGVLSLGQRRDYERKAYNHSSCKGNTKRSTHAGTDGSEAGGRGKAKTNAGNEIYHFH